MENNFPAIPFVKDGNANLEWHNKFGERICFKLDIAGYTSQPVKSTSLSTPARG
jgi:hypothetical protein